jgi:hypothetical protein
MFRSIAVAGAAIALSLVAAPIAAASPQELGDRCVGNASEAGWIAIVDNNGISGADLQSIVPPERRWVITRWRVQVGPGIAPLSQQLVALQRVSENEDQLLGESAVETLSAGTNEFATRISVPESARIGLRGQVRTLFCHASGHIDAIGEGQWAIGERRPVKIEVDLGVPVIAVVEPDSDGDGYGDLTQDGCPSLAAVHTACPFVRLIPSATVTKRAILLSVSTGDPTQTQVSGQVAWGFRPKNGGPKRKLIVGLVGGSLEIPVGATVTFRLDLPKQVRRRLARLTPKEKLKAKLKIVATDVAGRPTSRELTVRLPGRKHA